MRVVLGRERCLQIVFTFVLLFSSSTRSAPQEENRDDGQGTQMQRHVVSCLLRADAKKSCNPDGGNDLSTHFMELMDASPEEFKAAVEKVDLSSVSEARMADVSLPILYLLPPDRLEKCDAKTLANVMRRHGSNRAIAQKLLSALDFASNDKRREFILNLGLGDQNVNHPVQAAVGEAAVRWWGYSLKKKQEADAEDFADTLARAGSPILAHLPPGFLAELPEDRVPDILQKLGSHPWGNFAEMRWSELPAATKRVWMTLLKRDRSRGLGQLMDDAAVEFTMLWAGATPDEIRRLQPQEQSRHVLQRLTMDRLQVRAMMSALFKNRVLTSSEFIDVFGWALQLSPAELQHFSVDETDFTNLPSADSSGASLPTLKQVLELVVAAEMANGNLAPGSAPGTWGRGLKSLRSLVHVLPASQLRNYSIVHLPSDALSALDSYLLSEKQARYLSANGTLVDFQMPPERLNHLRGLVRAVPTRRLVGLRTKLNSNGVLLHLLAALPPSHAARSAALFDKVRGTLHEPSVFEAVLRNPAPGQYFRLMSSRKLHELRPDLENTLYVKMMPKSLRAGHFQVGDFLTAGLNKEDSIEKRILLLPVNSMSAILGSARRDLSKGLSAGRRPWTAGSMLNTSRPLVSRALAGLTCADIFATELTDLPAVFDAYNQRRAEIGMAFPKRLHHCAQLAFEDYLEMKARVTDARPDEGLLAQLEPSEIEAFGGYVLTALPPSQLANYRHALHVLKAIGSLSPTELLAAVPDYKRLREFALIVLDKLKARNDVRANTLFHLGSLATYLPPEMVVNIDKEALKVFIEAHASTRTSLSLCADAQQRDVWYRQILAIFKEPRSWTSGMLASLGDLVVALPSEAMRSIRLDAWANAADSLAERTVFHRLVEMPGNDLTKPFVEACQSVLEEGERASYLTSVRRLVRMYLRASQQLLNTVEPAVRLLRGTTNHNLPTGSQSYRNRFVNSARRTTTTTSTTTESTTPSTTTTELPLEPMIDDFDAFMNEEQTWMVTSSPGKLNATIPLPSVPSTVIVRADNAARTTDGTTTLPPDGALASTTPKVFNSNGSEDGMGEFHKVARDLRIMKNSSLHQSTVTTNTTENRVTASVFKLPLLEVTSYPNVAVGDKSDLHLSNVTMEYSKTSTVSLQDSPTTPSTVPEHVNKESHSGEVKNRTKRAYDPRDDPSVKVELEEELSSDVPLEVTCDALRALGDASWLALVASDAEHMMDEELEDCVEVLGKLPLEPRIARSFWLRIMRQSRDLSFMLGDMGHLVDAMVEEDVDHLDLNMNADRALDTLSVIAEHVTDPHVLEAAAHRFSDQNPMVVPRSISSLESAETMNTMLVALGPMACYLPTEQLRLLLSRSGGLLHATHSLNMNAHRLSCNESCLQEMATHALAPWPTALGPVRFWTPEDVRDLGVIVAGLSVGQMEDLKRPHTNVEKPVSGLTASAVRCMSPEQLKVIGDELEALSTQAAAAVSEEQMRALSEGQRATVLRVRRLAFTKLLGPLNGLNGWDPNYSSAQSIALYRGLLWASLAQFLRWIL